MSKDVQSHVSQKEDEEQAMELENLIENYIKKSEELEKRENQVLQQVELLQSALASLHSWRDDLKTTATSSEPVPVDLKEVEEETEKIKKETQRIQEEIKQKIEDNKKLELEVERRKTLDSEKEVESVFQKIIEEQARIERVGNEEIESRRYSEDDFDLEPPYFKEKLLKLEEMEKNLKQELMLGSEEFKKKRKSLSDKIALLEWETLIHRQFIENLKKQN